MASGVLLGYRELVVLGGVAIIVVIAALAMVGRLQPVRVWRQVPIPRVRPGDEVEVRVGAADAGRGRPPQLLADRVRGPEGARTVELPARRPAAGGHLGYRLLAERRGVLRLGPLEARRRDPLGLVAARRDAGTVDRVWVHPWWDPLHGMPGGRTDDPQGVFDGGRAGSVSFHSLREYVPGDDVRHIHWRSTARHDTLMVREYVDTSHTRMTLVVDNRAGSTGDALAALDEAASASAAVAAAALAGRWTCELRLASGQSRESTSDLAPLLDLLSEAEVDRDAALTEELWRLRNRPLGDTVVLVSAVVTGAEARLFAQLRDRYPRLVLVSLYRYATPVGAVPGLTVIDAWDARELAARWSAERWPA